MKIKYFDIVEPEPVKVKFATNAYASGDSWRIIKRGDRFTLEYISGELSGKEKEHDISPNDALAMKSGSLSIDAILIKYGAS